MLKIMTQKAKELGVKLMLQTPVTKLIKEGGKIVGVVAEDRSGEEIQIKAKAVIVATGGFGDNPKMIKKYTGYEWGKDLHTFRHSRTGGRRHAHGLGSGRHGHSACSMELSFGVADPMAPGSGVAAALPSAAPDGEPAGRALHQRGRRQRQLQGQRHRAAEGPHRLPRLRRERSRTR